MKDIQPKIHPTEFLTRLPEIIVKDMSDKIRFFVRFRIKVLISSREVFSNKLEVVNVCGGGWFI